MAGFNHKCIICTSEGRKDEFESIGLQALKGEISWREAGRLVGTNNQSVRNHMTAHFESEGQKRQKVADDELAQAIVDAERDLLEAAQVSPPQVKALYLTAAHNLRGLMDTRSNQGNIIAALKAAQEITGMKAQHQLLLAAGQAMFAKQDTAAELPRDNKTREVPAIEAPAREMENSHG